MRFFELDFTVCWHWRR